MLRLRMGLMTAVVAVAGLTACGSSDDSTDPVGDGGPAPTPTISLQLSSTAINLVPGAASTEADVTTQGAPVTLTATITRGGGFTGSVDIAISGAPTGVTATANPGTIPGSATSSTIDVTAATNAAAGNSTLTVTASGTGVSSVTATFQITVAMLDPGSFSLALTPTSISVERGQQGTATVNITRAGPFTGSVSLAATAPAGLTATLDPASATGGTSTLTVAASGTVAAGAYTVTVTGNATGLTQQAISLGVTVTAAPMPGGNVAFAYCANEVPVWFAYQNEGGSWTRVNPVGSTFNFSMSADRGGVAWVNNTSGTVLNIYYGSVSELNLFGQRCGGTTAPTKTINGTMSGLSANDQGYVSLGGGTALITPLAGTGFTLNAVREGTYDLVASRSAITIVGQNAVAQLISMIIRRALNPANGSTLADLNMAGPEAFTPVQRNITINNLGADQSAVSGLFITTGGGVALLHSDFTPGSGGTTRQYYGVPNANRMSGDLHFVSAFAFASTQLTSYRAAATVFGEAVDRTVTLGPQLTGLNVSTVGTTPYARLRVTYAIQPEYDDLLVLTASQATANRTVVMYTSKAYLNGATTWDAEIPDFSGVTDWLNIWGPQAGVAIDWSFLATGNSVPGGLSLPLFEGAISTTATASGQITP